MHIKKELEAMAERMFTEDLLNEILAAHKKELDDTGYEVYERDSIQGWQALFTTFDEAQKKCLAEAETAHLDCLKYALHFGFTRGVYAGFHQHFTDDAEADEPFERLVGDTILRYPEMQRYNSYWKKRVHTNELLAALHEQLDEAEEEHLTSIEVAWDERVYGTLRYAFYLGYRYAFSIVEDVAPDGSVMDIIGKTLLTEHALGFTQTWWEREQAQESRVHNLGTNHARPASDEPRLSYPLSGKSCLFF